MKNKLMLFALLASTMLSAQSPQAFSYQAVARDNAGNVIADQNVSFRIGILQGSTSGTLVYSETHATTTNAFGLANLEIGSGTVISGLFGEITWGLDAYFLQVEMDAAGGTNYQLMGTSQLLSVPYALYSATTGDSSMWRKNGNNIYYNNGKVGIGTANPSTKLDVKGNSWINGPVYIGENDSTQRVLDIFNAISDWELVAGTDTNRFLIRKWQGDTVINLMGNGNIGIGTNAPATRLEVSSMLRITPSTLQSGCSESLRGGLYFNEFLNEYCFCDGSYWKQIDGGGYCECPDYDSDGFDVCNPGEPYDTDGLPGDCNDGNPSVFPDGPELCDALDNDCDNQIDELYPELGTFCIEGVGACQSGGYYVCNAEGTGVECNAIPGEPSNETCNGIDDDCNGFTDDNLEAPPCSNQQGVCGGSVMNCAGVLGWAECGASNYGPYYEETEVTCDGLDNDCDGAIDEMCTDVPHANSFYCYEGACAIGSCDLGWIDCDGIYSTGCEVNLNEAPNTCLSPYFLGNYPGDEGIGCGGTNFSVDNRGEYFYQIYMFEDCTQPFTYIPVGIRATLTVPQGIDYDLYLYDQNCTLLDQSTNGGSQGEYVEYHLDDGLGSDESRHYKLEVRFYSGSSCNNWTLQIQSYSE